MKANPLAFNQTQTKSNEWFQWNYLIEELTAIDTLMHSLRDRLRKLDDLEISPDEDQKVKLAVALGSMTGACHLLRDQFLTPDIDV